MKITLLLYKVKQARRSSLPSFRNSGSNLVVFIDLLAIALLFGACGRNPISKLAVLSDKTMFAPSGGEYRAHEVIVHIDPGERESLDRALEPLGGQVIDDEPGLSGAFGYYRVLLPADRIADDAISALIEKNAVIEAERNFIVELTGVPNDPSWSALWGLQKIQAAEAWNATTGSTSVVVAVTDTGVDYNHPDLAANMWKNPREIANNNVDDDRNGYVDDIYGWDFHSSDNNPIHGFWHGTHVAGTIGAVGNNSRNVVGVTWQVSLQSVKTLDSGGGTLWAGAQGILYAAHNGARVVNASWGCFGCTASYLDDAIRELGRADGVLIAAAGNAGSDNDSRPHNPASLPFDNIVSVAATDSNDQLASFSCYGKNTVDIAAPGVAIVSTMPNASIGTANGTSMATPHVAGAAALLLARNPGLSYSSLIARLYGASDLLPQLAGKMVSGGRLNVKRLIENGGDMTAPRTPTGFEAVSGDRNDVLLSWQSNSEPDLANYLVRWSTTSGSYLEEMRLPADATQFKLTNLVHNTPYYLVLLAIDRSGNRSAPTGEQSVRVGDRLAPPQVIDLTAQPLSGDLIRGRVSATSGEFSALWNGANAHDGRDDTSWISPPRSQPQEEEIVIDLLEKQAIDQVGVLPNPAYPEFFPKDFSIEASLDGSAWSALGGYHDLSGAIGLWVKTDVPKIDARFVRIRMTKTYAHPSGNYYASVAEISVRKISAASDALRLNFTAPGDNPGDGFAHHYDIRMSTQPIDEANFSQQTAVQGDAPAAAGVWESVIVRNLLPESTYYFALKAIDDANNSSPMSNVAVATTTMMPPASINDLRVVQTTSSSVTVAWTATGSNGLVGRAKLYDLRISTQPITGANFSQAAIIPNLPAPKPAGSFETATISGLLSEKVYSIAVVVIDDVGASSGLSNVISAQPVSLPDPNPPAAITDLSVTPSSRDALVSATAIGASSEPWKSYRWGASEMVDNQLTTFWASNYGNMSDPEWVVVDLAALKPVTRFRIHPDIYDTATYTFPRDFAMQASVDAINWSELVNVQGVVPHSAQWMNWAVPTTYARYVRFMAKKRQTNSTMLRVAEFETYALASRFDAILTWIAPGNDGWVGTAASYELRRSGSPITEENFDNAIPVFVSPPRQGGYIEFSEVRDLEPEMTHYFAMRAIDASSNTAPISNLATLTTPAVPPAAITDLAITQTTQHAISVKFTATGDDGLLGTATAYDIRYAPQPINDDNWSVANALIDPPPPNPAGTVETITIQGVASNTTFFVAVKVIDDTGASSLISNLVQATTGDGIGPDRVTDLLAAQPSAPTTLPIGLTLTGSSGSYSGSSTPDKLFDNNGATGWSTPLRTSQQEEWASFSLNGQKQIDRLRLRSASGASQYFPTAFEFQVRQSPTESWTAVLTEFDFAATGGWEEWSLGSILAAEARLLITQTVPWGTFYSATVSDLEIYAENGSNTALQLSWSAPRDVGPTSSAASYDVRQANTTITAQTFGSAQTIPSPTPQAATTMERLTLTALAPKTTYCFALTSSDSAGNVSPLSNSVCAKTAEPPPSSISDLAIRQMGGTTATLTWSAPGDDGTIGQASSYELRYATTRINTASWASATKVAGLAAPKSSGQSESTTVTGLLGDTKYYFAIRAADAIGTWSPISNNAVGKTTDAMPPSSITDLTARTQSATPGTIALTWTATGDNGIVGQADRYDLRLSLAPIDRNNFAQATPLTVAKPKTAGTLESMTLSGLQRETLYYVAIKVFDSANNGSEISNIVSARTAEESPTTITDLRVTGSGGIDLANASLTFAWSAPGDDGMIGTASAYDVRYSTATITSDNFSQATPVANAPTPRASGSTEEVTISGLSVATRYYVAIVTVDKRQNRSGLSNVVAATTPDAVAPEPVTDLIAATGSCAGCVQLSWTEKGDNAGKLLVAAYDLRWSTTVIDDSNFVSATPVSPAPFPTLPGQLRSDVVRSLADEAPFYFALKTRDSSGNWSQLSNVASAWTPDVAPGKISNLALLDRTKSSITVIWTATGDNGNSGTATAYDLRYSSGPISETNFSSAIQVTTSTPKAAGQNESAAINGLPDTTAIYVAIKAKDDRNNGSVLSNIVHTSTLDTQPPSMIADLQATTGSSPGTLVLRFTAPGDDGTTGLATRYDLRRSTSAIDLSNWDAATPMTSIGTPRVAGSPESITLSGLVGETNYHVAIRAIDDDDNVGPLSASVSATTLPVAPARISDLAATVRGVAVDLTWSAPGDDGTVGRATRYDVRYSTNALTASNFLQATPVSHVITPAVAGSVQTMTIDSLSESTRYTIGIIAEDDLGTRSLLSNVAIATTEDLTPPSAPGSLVARAPNSSGVLLIPVAATASSALGVAWNPENAIDGDSATSWSSSGGKNSVATTLTIELDSATMIDRVRLRPDTLYPNLFPSRFAIEMSIDGSSWSDVASESSFATPTSNWITWGFNARTARYVRVASHEQRVSGPLHYTVIGEVEIYQAVPTTGQTQLTWVAPGDDGSAGTASRYAVYRHTAPFGKSSLGSATLIQGAPTPLTAGTLQTMVVDDLPGETTFYWAVRAVDGSGNEGPLSTVVSATTNAIAPAQVDDLNARAVDRTSVTLEWFAPGDDGDHGIATRYELRYATSSITSENFSLATLVEALLLPVSAGSLQSVVVTGLASGTGYRFALIAYDEAGNASRLSNVLVVATDSEPDATPPGHVNDLDVLISSRSTTPLAANSVETSSEQLPGFGADNLSDGSLSTFWASEARRTNQSEFVVIDLTQIKTVDQLQLWPAVGFEALFPKNFEFQISVDKTTWSTVAAQSDVVATVGTPVTASFPATALRYVKVQITKLAQESNGFYYAVAAELYAFAPETDSRTVIANWTAPGDDGDLGQATRYDLRISSCPFDPATAQPFTSLQAPQSAGSLERTLLSGIANGTYCIGLIAEDEAGNKGALSNIVQVTIDSNDPCPGDTAPLCSM